MKESEENLDYTYLHRMSEADFENRHSINFYTYKYVKKLEKALKKSLKYYWKIDINGWIQIFQKSAPLILCKYV